MNLKDWVKWFDYMYSRILDEKENIVKLVSDKLEESERIIFGDKLRALEFTLNDIIAMLMKAGEVNVQEVEKPEKKEKGGGKHAKAKKGKR